MMRYWNPRAAEVIDTLETFNPDKVVLIPLYPQFSKLQRNQPLMSGTMLRLNGNLKRLF